MIHRGLLQSNLALPIKPHALVCAVFVCQQASLLDSESARLRHQASLSSGYSESIAPNHTQTRSCYAGPQRAQHELTDGRFGAMQFHAEPAVGILEAGAETDVRLSFAPGSQHRYTPSFVWCPS